MTAITSATAVDATIDTLWLDVVGLRVAAECDLVGAIYADPYLGLGRARAAGVTVASFDDERWRTCYALAEILHQRSLYTGVRLADRVVTLRLLIRSVRAGLLSCTWWQKDDPAAGWSSDALYYQLVDGTWWSDAVVCRLFDCYPCAAPVPAVARRLSGIASAARDAAAHVDHARGLLERVLKNNGVAA